jgi:hypothetical protein
MDVISHARFVPATVPVAAEPVHPDETYFRSDHD